MEVKRIKRGINRIEEKIDRKRRVKGVHLFCVILF